MRDSDPLLGVNDPTSENICSAATSREFLALSTLLKLGALVKEVLWVLERKLAFDVTAEINARSLARPFISRHSMWKISIHLCFLSSLKQHGVLLARLFRPVASEQEYRDIIASTR